MNRKGFYKSAKFPQRICQFYTSANGMLSDKAFCLAAADDGTVYIGTENGLNYTKKDGTLGSFTCGAVEVIHTAGNKVYFASENTLFTGSNGKFKELQTFEDKITGISGKENVFLVTSGNIYLLEGSKFNRYHETDLPAEGLCVKNGMIVSFSERSLMIFAGKRKHWRCLYPEHSAMPEFYINSVTVDEKLGYIWLGTDKGAYIYDNNCAWFGRNEIDCLPAEEVFDITLADDGSVIFSTEAGLAVLKNGTTKYLPATRWVCEEKVNCAIMSGTDIWTATDSGVSKISEKEMTLEEKAKYLFDVTEKYYVREPGFVTGLHGIENGDISTGIPSITDNDGLWTQTYIGALSFCYAVTKDKKILEAARRSMNACALLTKITGIKGFTARAVRFPGDPGYGEKLDLPIDGGEWHKAPDGKREWLGETSSDEMTGHFFGFSAYYDFCADKKEKEMIKEIICDIVDHILANNYRLCDIDGLPTTWACWDPNELNRKDMWMWEKGINSLEILTFLTVAYHVSGDEKYRKEFLRLAKDEHYVLNAAQHKKHDARVTHIDDNLGFLCSVTLLRLEEDPRIRSYLLMGLKHHWNYERTEHSAFFNLIYGAFTDDVCDLDIAIKNLRDTPLDFNTKRFLNSKRKSLDYDAEPERWGGQLQLKVALDIDERCQQNYDSNPYGIDGGRSNCAANTSSFLMPYWIGRYYGLIEE